MKRPSSRVRRARPLLGTIVEIEVEEEANCAIDAAFDAVQSVQSRMSFHEPGSDLSKLNRGAAKKAVQVDPQTYTVLQSAAELHQISNGLFDVSIAPELQALGFLPATSELNYSGRTPSFADVELLSGCRVRYHHPALRLDLGGIAKGFAVDQAVKALRDAGLGCGLVNAGGDLHAFGSRQFPVSIRDPRAPGTALVSVNLCNQSLATSAHYFAGRVAPGRALGPIINPMTRQQASSICSATVRAGSVMMADALTKVVMLLGEGALPILEHYQADALFVDLRGQPICSSGWHATFSFSN